MRQQFRRCGWPVVSLLGVALGELALDAVESAEDFERFAGDLTLVLACRSKNLRRACAMHPASVMPWASAAL